LPFGGPDTKRIGTLSGRLDGDAHVGEAFAPPWPTLSGAALAAMLSPSTASASVPHSLILSTVQTGTLAAVGQAAATGILSANVTALAKGVAQSMLLAKLKIMAVTVLAITALGGGTGAFTYRTLAAGRSGASQAEKLNASLPETREQQDTQEKEQPHPAEQNTDKKPNTGKSDKQRLQGTWIRVAGEVTGIKKDANDPKLVQWKLIFDGDRVTLPGGEGVPYTLDTKKQPKEIDVQTQGDSGPMRAIYQFEGAALKLSWKKDGGRPKDFDTRKNQSVLIIFKRRITP
jgi:uncharacterized protein (TIGR03067 family)